MVRAVRESLSLCLSEESALYARLGPPYVDGTIISVQHMLKGGIHEPPTAGQLRGFMLLGGEVLFVSGSDRWCFFFCLFRPPAAWLILAVLSSRPSWITRRDED